jgi:hypothetical protein
MLKPAPAQANAVCSALITEKLSRKCFSEGHGFSRAVESRKKIWALAHEADRPLTCIRAGLEMM